MLQFQSDEAHRDSVFYSVLDLLYNLWPSLVWILVQVNRYQSPRLMFLFHLFIFFCGFIPDRTRDGVKVRYEKKNLFK